MKPKSKRQVRVCELSTQLPELTEKLGPWAFKNCIDHIGYRNKMWTHCLSCGHVWPTMSMRIKTEKCESCGYKLKIKTTRKQKSMDWARFAVLDVVEEFQVIRYFEIRTYMKSQTTPKVDVYEVMQHWVMPDGKCEVLSMMMGGMGLSYDHFHGVMELRNPKDLRKYSIYVYKIHPSSKVWPVLKRNGFSTQITNINLFKLVQNLCDDSVLETLMKAKQFALASARLGDRQGQIHRFWPSIRIAIRSNYTVKDAITWLDYLGLIAGFGKDLRNAKYVCPHNLKREHDRYVKKRNEVNRRQALEREKQRALEDQRRYEEEKAAFFDLVFRNKNIEVKVLQNIEEFIAEAEAHKHCVFTNRYHSKPESLILSARVAGKPTETVEVSLTEFKIVQSRGLQNKATEFNKEIVELINRNMRVIQERAQRMEVAV